MKKCSCATDRKLESLNNEACMRLCSSLSWLHSS